MNFAILGGTHGNEPVGIKVINGLDSIDTKDFVHGFKTFLGNPKAYELGKRYVDSDLNRAFGKSGSSKGYEKKRSEELKGLIDGKFDFILDLHTTTSNMGLTVILTRLDEISLKAACFLKKNIPELKIIISVRAGEECPYTSDLAPSALTVEVGPVANNVVKSELVLATLKIVSMLLSFDFKKEFNFSKFECVRTLGILTYPENGKWMIHPDVDGHDFRKLENGDPLFIDINGNEKAHVGETIYPLFINEAAYQESNIAMEFAKITDLSQFI